MRRGLWGAALLFLLLPFPAHAASGFFHSAILPIRLNGMDKGEYPVFFDKGGRLLWSVETLTALGVVPANFPGIRYDHGYIDVASLAPGLLFEVDEREALLRVSLAPEFFARQEVSLSRKATSRAERTEGALAAFVNYAVDYSDDTDAASPSLHAPHEAVVSYRHAALEYLGDAKREEGEWTWNRHLTRLVADDPTARRRVVVGDAVASGGPLSGALNLGGVSVRSVFQLNPYFQPYVTPVVDGVLDRPARVDVFVNGNRVSSRELLPGRFEFMDLVSAGGASDIRVVKTYADGTVVEETSYAYTGTRLLKPGVAEYAYAAGWVRREEDRLDARYVEPAFIARHRVGLADWFTAGAFADLGTWGWAGGLSAETALGGVGELSLAGAGSRDEESDEAGWAATVAYNRTGARLRFGGELLRQSPKYATSSKRPEEENEFSRIRLHASAVLGRAGYLSARYEHARRYGGEEAKDALLTLSTGALAPLSVTLQGRYNWPDSTYATTLLLTLPLGKRTSAGAAHEATSRGVSTERLHVEHASGAELGSFYGVSASRRDADDGEADRYDARLRAGYAMNHATVDGSYNAKSGVADTYRLGVAGSLGVVDGTFFAGRKIRDGFILARVGDLDEIPVRVSGARQATTSEGVALLPSVGSYVEQRVRADLDGLPPDYEAERQEYRLIPGYRNGNVVEFKVRRLEAVRGRLVQAGGIEPRALEYRDVTLTRDDGTRRESVTGRDGLLFVENLPPGRWTLRVEDDDAACAAELTVGRGAEPVAELGEVRCAP